MKKLSKFLYVKDMINNTILNILLILFYKAFKNLKRKYVLNLIFSAKISKILFLPPVSAIIADVTLCAFVGVHLRTCVVHGYFSLGKTSEPTTKGPGYEVLP